MELVSLSKAKVSPKDVTTDLLKSHEIEELLLTELSKTRKFRKSSRNSMTPRMSKFIFGGRTVILKAESRQLDLGRQLCPAVPVTTSSAKLTGPL